MKYTLLSLGVLALCLAFCLCSMAAVTTVCTRTAERLAASLSAVREKRLSEAERALLQAEESWSRGKTFFGVVLRHEEMDEVLVSLAELREYLMIGDLDDYRATCVRLLTTLGHLREMELPSISNIL